jgi:adenosylcobinamide-phosphate synthase
VASDLAAFLAPSAMLLGVAVAADLALGDPVYAWHPIRLIGRLLAQIERALRAIGADGYGGGIALFVVLTGLTLAAVAALIAVAGALSAPLAWAVHGFLLYSMLALGDLVHHVRRIESAVANSDLPRAREFVRALVGRDTEPMDGAACRRAAVESLSENLTDGFISPLCWYLVGGLPGVVVFKVASTMDSMVGYKTPRYLRFGWCGARVDDAMNYVPARLTWIVISLIAGASPALSGRKALRIGWRQHAVLPGPNAGWSEAATAGALERRIVGPIWLDGRLVTEQWIGDPADPPLSSERDVQRAVRLAVLSGVAVTALGVAFVAALVSRT